MIQVDPVNFKSFWATSKWWAAAGTSRVDIVLCDVSKLSTNVVVMPPADDHDLLLSDLDVAFMADGGFNLVKPETSSSQASGGGGTSSWVVDTGCLLVNLLTK